MNGFASRTESRSKVSPSACNTNSRSARCRYFDAAGSFAADIASLIGGALPKPLQALRISLGESQRDLILAWRSPTETLLMTTDGAAFAAIVARSREQPAAGCLVEQTGGLWVWRVSGARTRDLLLRLGSSASIPGARRSFMSRVAELPVLALCVHAGANPAAGGTCIRGSFAGLDRRNGGGFLVRQALGSSARWNGVRECFARRGIEAFDGRGRSTRRGEHDVEFGTFGAPEGETGRADLAIERCEK